MGQKKTSKPAARNSSSSQTFTGIQLLGRGSVGVLLFLGMAGLLSGDKARVYGSVTRGGKGGVSEVFGLSIMSNTIFTSTNIYGIDSNMNDVQELISGLQRNGWTLTAIADEFEISRNAVDSWRSGSHLPRQAVVVKRELERMLGRKRIPKRRRMNKTV